MLGYNVIVHDNGDRFWYLNDELHREDGPAVELNNGNKEWWLNGERHREDGPACEWNTGNKYWFLNGGELTEKKFLQRTNKHVIIIDGKEIQISSESYKELQKSLK